MKIQLIVFAFILWMEILASQSPGPGPEYADIVFLVDSSDQLGAKSFPLVKAFISKLVSSLPIEPNKSRVGLAQYSDVLHHEFHLSAFRSRNPMLAHLKKNFGFRGGPLRVGNALREARRTYFSAPANGRDPQQFPPILVVLASAESEDDVEEASEALRRDGVRVISVGVQKASEDELRAMATSVFHFNLRTVRDLGAFSQNMTRIIQDATKYRDPAVDADTQVSFPVPCQKDSLADLVFLVDNSLGTQQDVRDLQEFLENVTSSLDVRDDCMRLGLMSYSDSTETLSLLKSSTTRSEFQQQVRKLSLRAGKSNAGSAIEQMRKEGFSESSGSRRAQGVPQITVLVTNRPSDDEVRDAALNLRLEGVTVFVVSTQQANATQLEEIASYPTGQTLSRLDAYQDLKSYSNRFLKKIQNEIWTQISTRAEQVELDKTGCVDTKQADIYFLIDGSTSIQEKQFEQIKAFMSSAIDMFHIGPNRVRVGVVQYSDNSEVEFPVSRYGNDVDLKKAVFNIKQLQGLTFTGQALESMLPMIKEGRKDRPSEVPCYLIVLTDGESHDSVLEAAERLRSEQVTIYAVGIGEAKETQLLQIAGEKERVTFGQNFDALKGIKDEVVHSICTTKGCEDMKGDIVFLVDSSGSIGSTNFETMKTFMKNLLAKIQIDEEKTRIGVIQFSDVSKEEFQLDKYFTQEEIYGAIDRMSLINRNTLTGSALTFVSQYFTPPKGARPGVRKFLILITDGEAQDDVRDPAIALRDKGVIIFSVGVYNANRTQLEEISGDGSLVFHVENFSHLKAIESKLLFRVCTLHDCKRIELLDVVFVLDHSGSIGEQERQSMINLTVHLVKQADVGRDRVQFGALKYSDSPEILFYLNTYPDSSGIIENLRRPRHTAGNTYTARALKHSDILFQTEHGSRIEQNVKQMLIVITDEESHDRDLLNDTASKLRDRGITIFAVGVGKANQRELEGMAGSKENAIHVDNFDKLKDTYLPLQESMCTNAQEVCNLQEADLIFLCDGSDLVSDSAFVTMTTFLSDLIDNFDIQSQGMKIGMAQYGSRYQEIIDLGNSLNKTQWKSQIQTVTKINGLPHIATALQKARYMFHASAGGRRNAGVPQTLVVITSGSPRYDVADAVKTLKDLGICVLVLGIGDVRKEQLLPITGNSEKIITFQDFNRLKSEDVKKRVVREICQSCGKTNCFVDIVVGFDISTHLQGQSLFQGHPQLESYLPRILEDITSIRVSCGAGAEVQVSLAFKVNSDQEIPAKFQIYQRVLFDSLLQVTVKGPTHLNAQFLQSLWDTFENKSASRGQVLLIFSDGLQDGSITMLEKQSDRLREAGLDGLLVVSLDAHDDFSSFEFGKGFDYRTHLSIGMMELGSTLSQYLGNIAERTCCCTFCKCPGVPGPHGTRGLKASKGSTGLKGSRGHRGEDGDPGRRGETGAQGGRGVAGCPGERGQKGVKGFSGYEGEHGDWGLDGLDGEEGFRGFPGEKGEKGDPGSQGSPGSRGPPGGHGDRGFPGDPGNPGLDSHIKGQKGSKGEQGRQGRPGPKGTEGSPPSTGSRGMEGRRGSQGASGEPGNSGPHGIQGAEGLQGPQGSSGNRGRKGEEGSQGHKGPRGPPGLVGPKGSIGRPGLLGRKGEPGVPGDPGPAGPVGQRGKQGDYGIPGYGLMGRKGVEGPRGFPGDMGQKGDVGDPGIPGEPGPKGFRGLTLTVGQKGKQGDQGSRGPPGRTGPKGMAGQPVYFQCGLIQFVRDHSPCWEEKCPVYPTELVFALDQSSGITERRFNEMRDIVTSIVNDLHIRENNCPVGARVVVVSYDSDTRYLIRSSDYGSKKQLLQLLSQIKYQVPVEPRDIGDAMRFVARNVFKRTPAGANVKRVAVFFSNGQAARRSSILTAAMEFSALDISPAVFAFNERVFLDEAFRFDSTGTFQVIPVPSNGEYEPLERLRHCTLCYDKCFPNTCAEEIFLPENSYMDVAFLLDNSGNLANDDFNAMKALLSSVMDNFNIASSPSASDSGDRIALLSYSSWGSSRRRNSTVKPEFEFTTYNNQLLIKNHIRTSLQQLSGEASLGHALQWATENLFPGTPNLRKHKVIFVISAGENHERIEFVKKMALRAKCQGYVISVISLGTRHEDNMEELASHPLDHHLIQLGRIHKPDLSYIVKFLKPFVYSVRRGFNQYPPPMLEQACRLIGEAEGRQNRALRFTAELHEVSSDKSSLPGWELGAERGSSFVSEDSGSNYLGYIPSEVVEPQKLVIKYEKNQESAQTTSFTSGHENHGMKEESSLTYEPGDDSLQEYYMDVVFLIDASQRVGSDEFQQVKALIISVLDYFHITPDPLTSTLGDRVAVLTYSPPGYLPSTEACPVYLEFDLATYNRVQQMKDHLQDSLQQLNGDVFIGHALQWTIDNVFAGTPNPRKNRVIFIISASETDPLDKEVLRNVSLRAKCQGYTLFVFSFGPVHNDKELEELASHPLDHHLVQLGRIHKPDLGYIVKFVKPFVHSVRLAINRYPSKDLRAKCVNVTYRSPESVSTEDTVLILPEVYEIEMVDSALSGEFGSQEQPFFELGNNHSNDSGMATDWIQKFYMLFLPGELMVNDKGEACAGETTAPADDEHQGGKDDEDP